MLWTLSSMKRRSLSTWADTWAKDQELEVIKSGGIHYKDVDIQEVSVQFIGEATAILVEQNYVWWQLWAAMRSPIRSWSQKCMCSKAVRGS